MNHVKWDLLYIYIIFADFQGPFVFMSLFLLVCFLLSHALLLSLFISLHFVGENNAVRKYL